MGSRYIRELVLNMTPYDVENIIQEYLRVNDFKLVNEKGENFYKTGGVMFPLRGFSYSYQNGILHLEAWNGKIGKELNIGDGKLLGAAAKVPYYNSILSLQGALENASQQLAQANGQQVPYQALDNGQMGYPAYIQPGGGMQQPSNTQMNGSFQQPIYTEQFVNNNQSTSSVIDEINKANDRNAMIAFWLALASMVLIFQSKFSLIVNVASYALGFKYGLRSQKRGYAILAIIINTLVMAITIWRIFF